MTSLSLVAVLLAMDVLYSASPLKIQRAWPQWIDMNETVEREGGGTSKHTKTASKIMNLKLSKAASVALFQMSQITSHF